MSTSKSPLTFIQCEFSFFIDCKFSRETTGCIHSTREAGPHFEQCSPLMSLSDIEKRWYAEKEAHIKLPLVKLDQLSTEIPTTDTAFYLQVNPKDTLGEQRLAVSLQRKYLETHAKNISFCLIVGEADFDEVQPLWRHLHQQIYDKSFTIKKIDKTDSSDPPSASAPASEPEPKSKPSPSQQERGRISAPKVQENSTPTVFKTSPTGFFNPTLWGSFFLLSLVAGIAAQIFVDFSASVSNIVMAISVATLPMLASFWAVSMLVFCLRLMTSGDLTYDKLQAPVGIFQNIIGVGLLLGMIAIATSMLIAMGGIPSELAFMKPLFEVMGNFLSTGLKIMGFDTLSPTLAVGGNLNAGIVSFLMLATPTLLICIFAERFITAHRSNEKNDRLSQNPDQKPFPQIQEQNLHAANEENLTDSKTLSMQPAPTMKIKPN